LGQVWGNAVRVPVFRQNIERTWDKDLGLLKLGPRALHLPVSPRRELQSRDAPSLAVAAPLSQPVAHGRMRTSTTTSCRRLWEKEREQKACGQLQQAGEESSEAVLAAHESFVVCGLVQRNTKDWADLSHRGIDDTARSCILPEFSPPAPPARCIPRPRVVNPNRVDSPVSPPPFHPPPQSPKPLLSWFLAARNWNEMATRQILTRERGGQQCQTCARL